MTLILASGSAARREILESGGFQFEITPADIDEYGLIADLSGQDIKEITMALAREKALAVSRQNHPHDLVIGSDQTLEFEGKILNKARSLDEAKEKLSALSGQAHLLHSAVCVVRGGEIAFQDLASAELRMKDLDEHAIDDYLKKNEKAALNCVGGYMIETEAGADLFSSVDGGEHVIMGMPSAALFDFLKKTISIKS